MTETGRHRNGGLAAWLALLLITLTGCIPKVAEPVTPFQAAQKQLAAEQWSEARRSLERELSLHPENLDARYDLALLLAGNGHAEDAAGLYQDNLARGWHLPSAVNLARYRQQSGQPDAANKLLLEATRNSPHEAIPWYLLAEASARDQQWQIADAQFQQAIKADPKNGFARLRYAGFLVGRHKIDEARQYGKTATQLLPDCAPCWRQYGDILRASGQNQESIAAYQRSLAIDPAATETRQQLIDAFRASGDIERADRMQRALDALASGGPKPHGQQGM